MTSTNLHPEYASLIEKYTTEKHSDVVPDPTEDPEVQEAANVDRFGFYQYVHNSLVYHFAYVNF